MNRRLLSLAALLAFGTVAVAPVAAQILAVPSAMNFQGRLATPSGNPVPDGTYSVRFSLWDALTGGTEKWNKTVANVTVKNGVFAVTLSGFPANTFDGNLWLEIKIGSNTALTPRTPLVSVPYAMKSALALMVPDGSITDAKISDVDWSKITNAPSDGLTLPFVASGSADFPDSLFSLTNTGGGGGIYGEALNSTGVYGKSTNGIGIFGEAANAAGVYGSSTNSSGVAGVSDASYGVYGYSTSFTAIYGETSSDIGGGVIGKNTHYDGLGVLAGPGYGVYGSVSTGYGGWFRSDQSAVYGANANYNSNGYLGTFVNVDGTNVGAGVYGAGRSYNFGSFGYGGYFLGGTAVYAKASATFPGGGYAVYAVNPWLQGYALYGDGVSGGTSPWYQASDARFKHHIADFSDALDVLLNLRGVTFDWKPTEDRHFGAGRQIGFLAQEVERVLPDLVHTDANGYKSVAYAGVVPVLVEAVKTLKKDNDHKAERLSRVEAENAELRARLERIEAALAIRK